MKNNLVLKLLIMFTALATVSLMHVVISLLNGDIISVIISSGLFVIFGGSAHGTYDGLKYRLQRQRKINDV